MGVEAFRERRHALVQRPAAGVQVLQVRGARIRGAADDVYTAILVAGELFDRVGTQVWIDSGGVHGQRRENRDRIGAHGVAHVAALAIEKKRRSRHFVAALLERLPAVSPVLLPKRAVGFAAAKTL